MRIIQEEELAFYNADEHFNEPEEVGIRKEGERWMVYATDERWHIITGSETFFENESDAWDNFILRLRASKRLREL